MRIQLESATKSYHEVVPPSAGGDSSPLCVHAADHVDQVDLRVYLPPSPVHHPFLTFLYDESWMALGSLRHEIQEVVSPELLIADHQSVRVRRGSWEHHRRGIFRNILICFHLWN